MALYQTLADYYEDIFPFSENKKSFFRPWLISENIKNVLDIGCATGELAFFAESFANNVVGIDLDNGLLNKAQEKKTKLQSEVEFHQMNMMDIVKQFQRQFHLISCIGNTLVHLQSYNEIRNFFADCQSLLVDKGIIIIQIVNYDRILHHNIKVLPEINQSQFQFKRYYDYTDNHKLIKFRTEFLIKKGLQSFYDEYYLYPLKSCEIKTILSELNFRFEFFGDFNGSDYTSDSPALISVSTK